jgi:heme/copper-type cytochrome/quinol oxidase subunit 2
MLGLAWLRRRKAGLPVLGEDERASNALVVAFGMVIPAIALVRLFIVANFSVASGTQAPRRGTTALTVEVIGHQWWWEVRYPGTHGGDGQRDPHPAGTSVDVLARPADVIHSFWVPELNRKIDMIPGRTNRVVLEADRPGIYRGQCAEFCGLQHAHMAMWVVAQPAGAFEAWLRAMRGPAARPRTRGPRGRAVFLTQGCADCHADPRHAARGRIGPDLTHLASRETLAALTIPNDPADLARGSATRSTSSPATGCRTSACAAPTCARSSPTWRACASDGRRRVAAARRNLELLDRIWPSARRARVADHDRPQADRALYLFTRSAFFAAGGVEALVMRTQLMAPTSTCVGPGAYNELLTMHGVTMIFFFVIPVTTGAFGNYLVPPHDRRPRHGLPAAERHVVLGLRRLGVFLYAGLFSGHGPDAGWFNYVPLASRQYTPDSGIDFYCLGLLFNGISTTAAAINFIVTILRLRAPGMSLNRMPLFCYAFLAVSFAIVFALPPLNLALIFLELERRLGFSLLRRRPRRRPAAVAAPVLDLRPPRGLHHHPARVRHRDVDHPDVRAPPMVAFPLVALAEILVAFIGFGVWAHHMFAVGLPTATTVYFAAASLIIVIPSGIQLFAWITTILSGTPVFRTPLLWIIGFIVFFITGGLTGIMFAAIPFDQQVTDTYFVVAHFHFVIFGRGGVPDPRRALLLVPEGDGAGCTTSGSAGVASG